MDIIGTALLSHHNGTTDRPIQVERDDGYVDEHSTSLYYDLPPQPHEVEVLKKLAGPVLDIGCGAGRHVLRLQMQGVEAVGIDQSQGALEACRLRGCRDVRAGDVMSDDLTGDGMRFETALLFGNNIGIGGSLAGAERLLRKIHGLMNEGGRLLMSSVDVSRTSNAMHLKYHERNLAAGLPKGQIRIRLRYDGQTGPWFDWIHLSPAELEDLCENTGWTVELIDAQPSGPYAASLRRMVR